MSGTYLFDVIDGLVATWRTATGMSAPGGDGVPVYDGPGEYGDYETAYVVVGASERDALDGDPTAGTHASEWRTMPVTAGHRDEQVTVPCVIVAQSGDQDGGDPQWSALRDDISTVIDALDTALRTRDGVAESIPQRAVTFSDARLSQEFTPDGSVATFTFTVTVDIDN